MTRRRRILEGAGETVILASGFVSVLAVGLICVYLLHQAAQLFGAPAFEGDRRISPGEVLGGTAWYPISDPPRFGILPLVAGTLWVSGGALLIAVPLGIAAALFIGELAPAWLREVLKPAVEVLAAVPSVVIGFIGLELVAPAIQAAFGLQSGLTALTGSVALAIMALPTIVTVGEDAIANVPQSYREASYALGANRWQTSWRVILPAASAGVFAAVVLGIGRVVGETMAVLMVTGNAAGFPRSFLDPARTMTATIAAELGETVHGSQHYHALFVIAAVLFAMTFAVNAGAGWILARQRARLGGGR